MSVTPQAKPSGQVPSFLGKYQVRAVLGRGAMGIVYDAWDLGIDRRVAIKTVRLADAEDEETAEALARFKREAQAAGRLSHPNIVGVYDYGETPDVAFIVMEFIEGRSLKSLIDQEKRLPTEEAAEIMKQVLAGLAYSHARGVIHRDVKPANIMITEDGQVKIADFGIARIESSSMTSVGTVMGTPAYMPPEQFLGEAVDARSDIYAAGVMLFHLLVGERPYEGSMTSIMTRVLSTTEAPPLPSAKAPVPVAFDRVVATAMARVPAHRYPSAGAFSTAIQEALQAPPPPETDDATIIAPRRPAGPARSPGLEAAPVLLPPVAAARPSRMPVLASVGAALLLAIGGGAYFVLHLAPKSAQGTIAAAGISPRSVPGPAPAAVVNPVPVRPPPVASLQTPPSSAQPAAAPPPAPDPGVVLAQANAALDRVDCAALTMTDTHGALSANGLVGAGNPATSARAALAAVQGGRDISWSANEVPALYCPALAALQTAGGAGGLRLSLNGSTEHTMLQDRTPIVPHLVLPDFPSWLTVFYLTRNDPTHLGMQALYPELHQPARVMQSSVEVTLTTRGKNGVGPPFGRDLVIAIASGERLFLRPRPPGETTAQYLAALQQALQSLKLRGVPTSGAALVVDTEAKQ